MLLEQLTYLDSNVCKAAGVDPAKVFKADSALPIKPEKPKVGRKKQANNLPINPEKPNIGRKNKSFNPAYNPLKDQNRKVRH